MQTRRSWVRVLAGGLVALAVPVIPALAEELLGTIKSVDADAAAQDQIGVGVTHDEDDVASKIVVRGQAKKKDAPKKDAPPA